MTDTFAVTTQVLEECLQGYMIGSPVIGVETVENPQPEGRENDLPSGSRLLSIRISLDPQYMTTGNRAVWEGIALIDADAGAPDEEAAVRAAAQELAATFLNDVQAVRW